MTEKLKITPTKEHAEITVEDVKRVLEIGRLLRSVLTEEEIKDLQALLSKQEEKIGNTGDS